MVYCTAVSLVAERPWERGCVGRTEGIEPTRAEDEFVIIGKLSAWQISDVREEESG